MSKAKWKSMVRNSIVQKTFKRLEEMKETHSKVKNLKYVKLEMQDYLIPNNIENMKKEEVQNIFKIRSKVMDVKMNRNKDDYGRISSGRVHSSKCNSSPHSTMVKSPLPKDVVFSAHMHMHNAAYISSIMWNSISG